MGETTTPMVPSNIREFEKRLDQGAQLATRRPLAALVGFFSEKKYSSSIFLIRRLLQIVDFDKTINFL